MSNIFRRICIYLTVVIVVFAIFLLVPGFKAEVSPLGNVLSSYFYFMHSNTTNNIPRAYANHIKTMDDPELKKFYSKFTWERKNPVAFASARDTTWQMYNTDGTIRKNYSAYWQAARPSIRAFYAQNIKPVTVKDPVIHFRCSDAPFVEHPTYHLTKAETVKWMAAEIKSRGYDKVIILACNKHNRAKNNPCAKFYNFYAAIFKDAGLQVHKQCHSIYQDFALMVNAPVLVALNASSFSFMAGIAKDPHNFISCNLGREHEGQYLLHTQPDWMQDTRAPLLHSEVNDYFDVKEVLSKLQN